MNSKSPLDDLVTAMGEVGLQVWMLCDNGAEGWYCALHNKGSTYASQGFHGNGPTAARAMLEALKDAGCTVEFNPK